ncbi:hypothetical protein LTR95_015571 [Oleoguttula sp. CCFEE 5521]
MTLRFKKNRLLVGYTREEWHEVWYYPGGATEDGGAELGFFRSAERKKGDDFRVPKEGEIIWFPFWNPNECGTSIQKEKRIKHQQVLSDAWNYLHEKDPLEVAKMQKDLEANSPGSARELKETRARRGGGSAGRRSRPEDDTSDEDSDGGSDPKHGLAKTRAGAPPGYGGGMGPPPRPPRSGNSFRSSMGNATRGRNRGSRTMTQSSSQDSDSLFMSPGGTPSIDDMPTPSSLNSTRLRRMPGGAEGIRQSRESTATPPNKRQRTGEGNFNGEGHSLRGPREGSQFRPYDVDEDDLRKIREDDEAEARRYQELNGGEDEEEATERLLRETTVQAGDRHARYDSVPEETPAP